MRDDRIDVLRFIGLAMIILAHTGPPEFLSQLRSFDVPLMVLVSGLSFGLSYSSSSSYGSYLWKRVKRLVIPVWIFLTMLFVALALVDPNHSLLNQETLLLSYGLVGGLGYMWIIRVFLLVAALSPFIYAYHKKTESQATFFSVMLVFLLANEIVRYFSLPYIQEGAGMGVSLFSHYVIPYAAVFAIGLRLPSLTRGQLSALATTSLVLLLVTGLALYLINGSIVPTKELKYPPSVYYLSYAIFVSILLWLYIVPIARGIEKLRAKAIVMFAAQNSIWIYLWHIPVIEAIDAHFAVEFTVVVALSMTITYVQVILVRRISATNIGSDTFRRNLNMLLTG